MTNAEPSMTRRVFPVALLLLLSGMCALVYQITWQREFRLVFGGSTAATGAVLAIFMGGLGLGNAWLGRRADAHPRPLAFYARLELLIAVSAAASPLAMALVRSIYFALGGQTALGLGGATLLRLGLSALVLGVPTVLMGGTLPAAARAVTTAADANRRNVGMLYGMNTVGAVVGAVLSTFYLLETLGMRRTLWLACAVNLAIAALAARMARHSPVAVVVVARSPTTTLLAAQVSPEAAEGDLRSAVSAGSETRAELRVVVAESETRAELRAVVAESETRAELRAVVAESETRAELRAVVAGSVTRAEPASPIAEPSLTRAEPLSAQRRFVYFAAALVGFAFFLMELVWFRMLGPLLGGTTFTFGLILAVALSGIGLGGALYPLVFRRYRPTLFALAITCGLEALALAIPYALGDRLALLAAVYRNQSTTFAGLVVGWTIVAAIVILPAALLSGVQFPLLVALLGKGDRAVGRQVGAAFAWNTLGAIAGSLAGGFGILPWLGAPVAWCAVVAMLCGLGLLAVVVSAWAERRRLMLVIPAGLWIPALVCLAATGPTAVWRHSGIGAGRSILPRPTPNAQRAWIHDRRRAVVWEAEGVETSVALAASNGYAFIVNGKSDGNAIGDAATQIGPALVGGILHPHPTSALVVGLGSGETAGWLAEIVSIQRVDVVELEPAIDKVAEVCAAVNRNVLKHPKAHRLYNDGREVLLTAPRPYDLIVSEPSNPYRAGVASLYTREYYQAALDRLTEDGLFLQWFQAYEVDAPTVRTVLATLASVFRHVEIWQTRSRDMLLVCSRRAIPYPVSRQRARLGQEPFKTALAVAWRAVDLEGFLAHYLAGPALVRAFCQAEVAPLNSDDQNFLEYGVARTVGHRGGFQVEALRAEAAALSAQRPAVEGGTIDWDRVEDNRLSLHAVQAGAVPLHAYLTAEQRTRGEVLSHYLAGQMRAAIDQWESAPRQPLCPTELTVLAHAYAALGNSKAQALADRVRDFSPTEAEAVTAILQWRQGRAEAAGDSIETTLHALRTDPWALQPLIVALLDTAVDVAAKSPARANALFAALEKPFAAALLDDKRLWTAYLVARRLGPGEIFRSLQPYEPNVPWKELLLKKRAEVYTALGDPRAASARADVQWYDRHEP
jgi:predicted membrane-bound spermidine synthase